MTWRINVPSRAGVKRGWLVLRDGEPCCPFHPSQVHPSRAAAREAAARLRVLRTARPKVFRVASCTLVLGWAK